MLGGLLLLAGYWIASWQGRADVGRAAEELHQCQSIAAGLTRTVERAVEMLALRIEGREPGADAARQTGVTRATVADESLGGKPRWTIPARPFDWQETACDADFDEELINGGCWVWTGRTAPCSPKTFENLANGKCYRPVNKSKAVPRSEEREKGR
jgi:hypothetical protein